MKQEEIRVNESTSVTVLSSCAQLGCSTTGERISTYVINHQLILNVWVANGLIDMYTECGKLSLFDNVSNKNIVTWNVMIGGYTHTQRYKDSLEISRIMLESNYEPNEVALISVITASLNAMISGLAMQRRVDEAIELFKNMVYKGLSPDDITFVGVLSACSHVGLVNLGIQYFNLMIQEYKISPKVQHYGCVIDLLSRAGLFVEAMDMINNMEVNPDGAIWGSLFEAHISYKNVELGEYYAKKVLDLDPESSGAHTLLSNLYATNGKWDNVARIRIKFKDEGSKKIPGCTSLEVDGIVHKFLASDKIIKTDI